MNGDDVHLSERQAILTRLLDAVKQCQVRFGGRSELATDSDSRVSCLCSAWESALQHGMKKNNKAFSAFKQMTERTGLSKVTDLFSDIKRLDSEPVFWHYAKDHLTKDEFQRFNKLKLVNTDAGKGRAWLRASLNEHSLERYMHMLIESDELLSQCYEDWAFLRDGERNSMLPNMAAGLGSILFAITVDRPELNKSFATQNAIHVQSNFDSLEANEDEPRPVISESVTQSSVRKKEKKKKKKVANVVSFDEDETVGTVITKSSAFNNSSMAGTTDILPNPESRESGEGTNETVENTEDVFSNPKETVTSEESKTNSEKELYTISSQASILSSSSVDQTSKSSTGSFSDMDQDTGTFMTPVGVDGVAVDTEMMPLGADTDQEPVFSLVSGSVPDISDTVKANDIQSASLALALAQQSLSNSNRTAGDGGDSNGIKNVSHDGMSYDELKHAVVTMMLRKDSVQEQSRKLEGMLQHEMETSSTLRAEIEELSLQNAAEREREQAKIQNLQKENELLKHQLKKYVSAVQMLRTEGIKKEENFGIHFEEPQPSIPPAKPMIDYSHEASEYEKKLIQVAEMHGELMEFNEMLHRQLNAKEAFLRQLKQELILLRGPVSLDILPSSSTSSDILHDGDSFYLQHTLINIWIPSAFLRGSANSSHHVYQVYVRIRDEEWNVYRRYSQFLNLHVRLKKVYPLVGKFEFPPKKAIGKKEAKLVESRRQMFQRYLRNIINLMMERNEQLASNANKERLISYLPFFNEKQDETKGRKSSRIADGTIPISPPDIPEGATGAAGGLNQPSAQYEGF